MAGGKGKGKASASKSKPKNETLALVPADPEPLKSSIPESADNPSNGMEGNTELSNGAGDNKDMDETSSGLVVVNGHEEMEQFLNEGNDKGAYAVNQKNDASADIAPTPGEGEEDPERVSEGGAAASVTLGENEDKSNQEDLEEVPDGGSEANNLNVEDYAEKTNEEREADTIDVEDNVDKTNEVVVDEEKEPLTSKLGMTVAVTEEEKKSPEVAEEGKMVIDEMAASVDLQNVEETNKLNSEEAMSAPANNGKECTGEDASIAINFGETPEKGNRPKRKLAKKKVIKKKVPRNDVVSVNPQSLTENGASGEATKVDENEQLTIVTNAEVKPPVKITKKLNRRRKKKVPEDNAGTAVVSDEQKSEPTNEEPVKEEKKEIKERHLTNEEVEKSGVGESRSNRRRKKQLVRDDAGKLVEGDTKNPGPSKKSKASKKLDSMGMIFMCSSETKKDCYRYKVLGLPAAKKDIVSKIYKGMRLFLFDFKLRMMYGIYKAAGPGGYNIEPRAFKSQFPSQVRFTVLEDCVPLAEEKFKKVIKENYYTKNKFNFELTNEQVKKLCKLFHETSKKAESTSKRVGRSQIAAASTSAQRDKKRKRVEDSHRPVPTSSLKRGKTRRRAEEEPRRAQVVVDDRYYQQPIAYERETYLPPATTVYHPLPIAQSPPRVSSYAYARAPRVDVYRRDAALEHREVGLSSLREVRHPIEAHNRDPYVSYRGAYAYREPEYETAVRRDPYETGLRRENYETGLRRENYETSATRRPEHFDYLPEGRRVEYYRPTAEYQAPLPPYRRY